MRSFTSVEHRIDERAHRLLDNAPASGIRSKLVEFAVFALKQAWACIFGAALLAVILAAVAAVGIYANFFSHHYIADAR